MQIAVRLYVQERVDHLAERLGRSESIGDTFIGGIVGDESDQPVFARDMENLARVNIVRLFKRVRQRNHPVVGTVPLGNQPERVAFLYCVVHRPRLPRTVMANRHSSISYAKGTRNVRGIGSASAFVAGRIADYAGARQDLRKDQRERSAD